jgi:hypothetical protein
MITAPEKLAYARGYNAGRKRKARNVSAEQIRNRERAFWQRAFLSSLQTCITVSGWTVGDKPITTITGRTQLARDFANEALRVAISYGYI